MLANEAIAVRYVLDRGKDDGRALRVGEAVAARRDLDAGGEPLDVPLPRTRQGLVEVVDVEHELALGRREQPEVRQVGVTTRLDPEPGGRRARQVGGHDQGCSAIEREGRGEHPSVADRHELLNPGLALLLEQRDRVGPRRWRVDDGMTRPRHLCAGGLAPRRTLGRRQMGDLGWIRCIDVGGESRRSRLRRELLWSEQPWLPRRSREVPSECAPDASPSGPPTLGRPGDS